MQDKAKIEIIQNIVNELKATNNLYIDERKGFYFDYDTVIDLLQKASETMVSTARCPRPKDIPEDIPWCESMNEEFDPFVYRGDMSIEDFRKAQNNYLAAMKDDNK
jgi:hypothetical protein